MTQKTRILIVEHDQSDIELTRFELKKGGLDFESEAVQNEKDFRSALKQFVPDLILADYSFPSFDGVAVFRIKEELSPDTPFIFVSGTIGEEKAVELIKKGVTDYVLKDKLFTLYPKIIRALEEAEKKREKIILGEKLHKANNLYAFSCQVNQNIVRVKDEATLFRNSCLLAIELGKFKMSWIGLFNHDQKKISLVEQCGIEGDLLSFTSIASQAKGPQEYVLRTGRYFISNDIQNDLKLQSWKPFGVELGINSCIVLPIRKSGEIIGTFNLYSAELNFSSKEEIKILLEFINDISFALDLFEKAKKQKETDDLVAQHSKNLEQFTSIVSHNLRAPVAHIMGLSDVLKQPISTEERARCQQFLFDATEKLDEILKDLNKILEVRSEITRSRETVYLEELVNHITSSIPGIMKNEHVQVIIDFSAINQVNSLKSYIYSIFYNLISNSIKYRHPERKPVITIRSGVSREKINISFSDNGIGIDLAKHGDKLFGLYRQFHPNSEGKGLGLFMVKAQVETLGGTIRTSSKLNEGTEFILEMPL